VVIKKVKASKVKLDRKKVNEAVAAKLKETYLGRKGIPVPIIDKKMRVVSNFETAAVLKDVGVSEFYVEQINI
jgi:hypothetical protein